MTEYYEYSNIIYSELHAFSKQLYSLPLPDPISDAFLASIFHFRFKTPLKRLPELPPSLGVYIYDF